MDAWVCEETARLDRFLLTKNPQLSRAQIQKFIDAGLVKVNGFATKKIAQRVRSGDTITLKPDPQERSISTFSPEDLSLRILYEDQACLVIDKPAGIAVHPGTGMARGESTLLNGIAFLFEERNISFTADSVLVHRLDKDTTGCMLIAKTPEAHRALQAQFKSRTVRKWYLALVAGVPKPATAIIDAPVGRNLTERTKMSVLRTSVSRDAKTTYRTLEANAECALLECEIHTGRTHQVRVHLTSIGHPLLGDETYRSPLSQSLKDRYAVGSLCLHAWKLAFASPVDGSEHSIVCTPPPAFLAAVKSTGLHRPVSA